VRSHPIKRVDFYQNWQSVLSRLRCYTCGNLGTRIKRVTSTLVSGTKARPRCLGAQYEPKEWEPRELISKGTQRSLTMRAQSCFSFSIFAAHDYYKAPAKVQCRVLKWCPIIFLVLYFLAELSVPTYTGDTT